jgi:prolipoprotein diacylglyceryltransferase
MQPIMLILLAVPSLCYAHNPSMVYVIFGMYGIVAILSIFLLLSLFVKNEKSDRPFKTKLIMRFILFLVFIFVLAPAIMAICEF